MSIMEVYHDQLVFGPHLQYSCRYLLMTFKCVGKRERAMHEHLEIKIGRILCMGMLDSTKLLEYVHYCQYVHYCHIS